MMGYNRYQPQGGIDQGQAEWLGGMAYDPYSKGTNLPFALRNTLNNLLGVKQQQEQANKKQREAQDKIDREERKAAWEMAAEERRLKVLEQPKAPTEKQSEIDAITRANPTWTQGQVLNKVYGIKTEADIKAEKDASLEDFTRRENISADIRAAHPTPGKPEDRNWKISQRQKALLDGTILRKSHEKDSLVKQREVMGKSKGAMFQSTNFDPNTGEPTTPAGRAHVKAMADIDNKIQDLADQAYELGEYQIGLGEGLPLDEGKLSRFHSIVRGVPKEAGANLMDVLAPIAKSLFGGATPAPPAPSPIAPPTSEPDPDLVQTTARDIIDRQAKKGITVSEEEGVALAIQYLQGKQNAPR